MTNTDKPKTYADKYLKDGVSEYDFLNFVFNEGNIGWNGEDDYCYIKKLDLLHLLQQPLKPTLTEDEKVILRNMKHQVIIFRGEQNELWTRDDDVEDWYLGQFEHLFQFIQPRRRI